MSGPENYREAQRLSGMASMAPVEDAVVLLAAAQVHATLAHAAATIATAASRGPGDVAAEWMEVTA